MKRSTERILTTPVGCLACPKDLFEIAERIVNYAKLVGRENVIGGGDCGFSSQATFTPEVHPTIVWAKFQAMAEGAQIASRRLWRRS